MNTLTHTFPSMNTTIEIYLEASPESQTSFVLNEVNRLFYITESLCSRFNPMSELSLLHSKQGRVVQVSPPLLQIFQDAEKAYHQSGGIYNPGILRQLLSAGYNTTFEQIPKHRPYRPTFEERHDPVDTLPYRIVDTEQRLIVINEATGIDLGGIAKGWSVDRAAELLAFHGAGFINAGGDLRVFGYKDASWKVGIEDPLQPDRNKAIVHLSKGAVATSSTWKRSWCLGEERKHHLLSLIHI